MRAITNDVVRTAALILTISGLLLPTLTFAQIPEEPDVDYSYDMFYPKYAKGLPATAFDVNGIDDINLYNGSLSMSLPIGPPLRAGADLSWQLALHYSSAFWSDDHRDGLSGEGDCEGYGYIVGDAYVGIGWTFRMPQIHLRRIKDYSDEYHLYVDSVIGPDGSRHQLRPCRDSWDCRDSSTHVVQVGGEFREYWYAADGSGWRVYRTIQSASDQFGALMDTSLMVAEADGYRYTFAQRYLLDPASGAYDPVETDFLAEARGWYCTRIESIRWPGPHIDITYQDQGADTYPTHLGDRIIRNGAPIPKTLTAVDVDGHVAGYVSVAIGPDSSGSGDRANQVDFLTKVGGSTLARYVLDYASATSHLDVRADRGSDSGGSPELCDDDLYDDPRNTTTRGFRYLEGVRRVSPVTSQTLASWSFSGYSTQEAPARLKTAVLPNSAELHYTFDEWASSYPKFCSQTPIHWCGEGGCGPQRSPESEDCRGYYDRHNGWGVTQRLLVDAGDRVLEWTEYLHPDRDDTTMLGMDSLSVLNLYGRTLDFANRDPGTSSFANQLPGPGDLLHFYQGFQMTVVRRHLMADESPGDIFTGLDYTPPLTSAGLVVDLPTSRFDDTMYIFSNGRFIYDVNHDGYVDSDPSRSLERDLYGSLPLDGKLLEVRRYRGSAENLPSYNFKWWESLTTHPRLVSRTLYTYTLDLELDSVDQLHYPTWTLGHAGVSTATATTMLPSRPRSADAVRPHSTSMSASVTRTSTQPRKRGTSPTASAIRTAASWTGRKTTVSQVRSRAPSWP